MPKITKSSAPFSGPSFSPPPQNPNSPTGSVLADGVSQKTTIPTEISIESLVPYTPRGRKPLEAPIPPFSTPRYTMTNGLNFGGIACPSEAPVFGRRIKVPRGLVVTSEPAEFAFVSEKQCKLPMRPAEAIFTAGKPIKPLRKSLLLAKELEISFADASVPPEAGDEPIEGLEDEVVGVSSGCLESSLSLALKTPLPEDDEPHSEDVSLTHSLALNASLQVRTGFYSEHTPATPKIENEPSLGVSDDKPLVEAPLDSANARSKDITIPAKAIFPIRKPIRQLRQPRCRLSKEPEIAFVNASVSRKVVFGGMGPSWLGDRLEGADEVIGGLEGGAITLKPHTVTSAVTDEDPARYLSIAVETLLPDDDELCSEDASPSPSPALNTLPLDTESGSEFPLPILECQSPLEAGANGKPLLETPRGVEVAGFPNGAVLAKDMYTAGGSIKQLRKHSALLVKEPEVSFEDTLVSQETRSKAAGISGLEGADEEVICVLGDDVVLSVRASEITTKGWVDKLFCALVASHDSSSEYLASSLSLALKNPLPEDSEPFSEDVFILSPALNSALPIRTEFDADDNKGLEAPQDVVIAKSPDSPVSTEGIFTAAKLIKPLCKGCAVLAKNQEISPTNALVSWKVVYGGAGADGRGDGDGLVDELEDRVKTFESQIVSSNISSEDRARYLSITVKIPLPEGVETCSEDASLAFSLSFNAPLPINTRLGSEYHPWTPEAASPVEAGGDNKSLLEAPQGVTITRSPGSDISIGVLADGVGDGCLEGSPDAGAWGEQEQPEEKRPHSQFQDIGEPSPAAEVAPIITEATFGPKASLLDNVEPGSQGVPLTHSLAINTPLPVDTEFCTEGHLPITNIEPPLGAEDGKLLLESAQDVLITRSPCSSVSTEAPFSTGKPIMEPDPHRALPAKEPEIMFDNPSVSAEISFCGVGAGRLTGVEEIIEEPQDEAIAHKIQTVSLAIGSEDLASSLSLALKTPLPEDDDIWSEDTSLTHSLAVNIPLLVDTDTNSESPLPILKTESSPKVDEKESFPDSYQDIGAAGSAASSLPTNAMHATKEPIKPLCQHRPPLSRELGIALDSALVSLERMPGGALLALSHSLNTPLPLEDESDFESPLSNLEVKSPLESDDRSKPLPEALQDVVIPKSPEIAISMGESFAGVVGGSLGDEGDQERKRIDAGNEQDTVGNTHPRNRSLSTKDLNLTLKANTTATECTFDLPSQEKGSASRTEAYGHCQIFKNPAITPSTSATTLGLRSDIVMGGSASSSTLSSEVNTGPDTRGPDPTLVGFGETKFEFDLTDMFIGMFKEVGVVDLALSTITPSTSAGITRPLSQDLQADEGFQGNQVAGPRVDARREVPAVTSGNGKEKKSKLAAKNMFAKLGKVNVRKSVIKLFNKFSPMPVDVVE